MGNGERVDACWSTASRVLSARLASPCACRTSNSSAPSASSTLPLSPFPFPTSCNARSITTRMWASVRGSNTNTRQRESSGAVSSKLGFSVVAPISVMIPFSTQGRNASCCARLNRWISSQKRIVPRPSYLSRSSACWMISRTRHTFGHGRKRLELAGGVVGDETGERGLPRAGGPPEDARPHVAAADQLPQGFARPEEVFLAEEFLE